MPAKINFAYALLLCLTVPAFAQSGDPANPPNLATSAGAQLTGRWTVIFDMPQASFETPVEFISEANGRVVANLLGPLGSFRIANTSGSLKDGRLALRASTSFGKLKMDARLAGNRLTGRWAPTGLIAGLFFKGDLRGLRDENYAPGSRTAAFDATWSLIDQAFYAPDFNGVDLRASRQAYRERAIAARTDGEFLSVMRELTDQFHASHMEFFATPSWTPALHTAETAAAETAQPTEGITWKRLSPDTGYLRIESFEDGAKVVQRVDMAFAELGSYPSLIIDLRGNGGGALSAAMRLGDHILPRMMPVGYFAGRDGLAKFNAMSIDEIEPADLPVFDGYDSSDFARQMAQTGAVMLSTGGRAEHPFRGQVVLLVDENSFSASEALASVAQETGAATLIGRPTQGAMLGATPFAIEGGWTLYLPVWDFRTPGGGKVEGRGVRPDITVRSRGNADADLATALKYLETKLAKRH